MENKHNVIDFMEFVQLHWEILYCDPVDSHHWFA